VTTYQAEKLPGLCAESLFSSVASREFCFSCLFTLLLFTVVTNSESVCYCFFFFCVCVCVCVCAYVHKMTGFVICYPFSRFFPRFPEYSNPQHESNGKETMTARSAAVQWVFCSHKCTLLLFFFRVALHYRCLGDTNEWSIKFEKQMKSFVES